MNMHGFISPAQASKQRPPALWKRLLGWVRDHKPFMFIVVLPTLLVSAYFYGIAANQYQTEAHFVIQSAEGNSMPSSFGDVLGISGPLSPSQSQAMGVSDYLGSQDAVNALNKRLDLVTRFRRPEADPLARLHPADPTPERLLAYYKDMIYTHFDKDSGISTLQVKAFRPQDSYQIIRALLDMGEERVNELNQRSYRDAVSSAQVQVAEAEQNAREIEAQITAYRQQHADINPTTTGEAQTTLVTTMTANLSSARAQLAQMGTIISRNSPQYRAMAARVGAIEAEVGRQSGRLTGGGGTVASRLGGYEDLKVRQQFAAKRYDSAEASLEKAREQVRRQSLYLLRIVDPTMPVKSLFPERGRIVFTVLLTLLVVYSIGWLIVAGVREHTA